MTSDKQTDDDGEKNEDKRISGNVLEKGCSTPGAKTPERESECGG